MTTAENKLDRLRELITDSGCWASYGDVAEAIGRKGAARSIANEGWKKPSRLARANGDPYSEDGEKEQQFALDFPAHTEVDQALGFLNGQRYHFTPESRLTVAELQGLLGEREVRASLRIKVDNQIQRLERGHPTPAVADALTRARALLNSLHY